MKKISISLIICIIIVLFRENICFFYGNVLGVFKLDNDYNKGIIRLNEEKIKYLEEELNNYDQFSKNLYKIEYNYKISKIIYKESYNMSKYNIQYGTLDGVKLGMAVTNELGLVGKITKTNKNTSELTVLKDLKDVSVMVGEEYGRLNYNYVTNEFIISDISNYDKVYINDNVYTSGYGSIKEKLYIGKVIKIENETVSKKVYIDVDTDFNNLNYVLIVGDFKWYYY